MLKKAIRLIKDGQKLIAPTGLYLRYYAKKHDAEFRQLMDETGAPEYYKSPEVKRDYFKSLELYGFPVKYYKELELYEMKDKVQKDSYMAPGRLLAIWDCLNGGPSREILDNKVVFLKKFSEFLERGWIYVPGSTFEEFEDFCIKHPKMLVKRTTGSGGKGIHIFEYKKDASGNLREIFDEFIRDDALIEEYIDQKGILHELNPASVNSIRICTLRFKDHVEVFQCFLKMGNGEVCVDNISYGGVYAPIDVETGVITGGPFGAFWSEYPAHPYTGLAVEGIQIPYWDKVKKLVVEASDKVKDLIYVSWDVAVSDDGKIYLIEGNSCGAGLCLKEGGEWPMFMRAIKENNKTLQYKLAYNRALKTQIGLIMSYMNL